jgi:hypothetical protein
MFLIIVLYGLVRLNAIFNWVQQIHITFFYTGVPPQKKQKSIAPLLKMFQTLESYKYRVINNYVLR